METEGPTTPYRQIRALYDEETITVYQAYSASIAIPSVREQRLNASSDFLLGRMTWIKPSWRWMMYRSGYSTKDDRQAHILALKMKHENFERLLSQAVLTHGALTEEEKAMPVRVQWDPERNPALVVLPYRSIQIGISRILSQTWVEEWIESIEDVTARALELKKTLEEEPDVTVDVLVSRGLMPLERAYGLPEALMKKLGME
ncbi:ATP-dependent RNA helicase DHX8 [Sistotremastrum niveocremeum HHB9708]|uniref:ATP-dependent RNA helicase DHX8 n=1 Tax=Sistotremastrum niveocremeum HHB9708 TaxID=1314777 RepID=A0A164WAA7_9AGAM|nr:ATP-dependent RNA helicase DHX8 [Sistotremastrum niveocremeum HHB9708]